MHHEALLVLTGYNTSKQKYTTYLKKPKQTEKKKRELAWSTEEYRLLSEKTTTVLDELHQLTDFLQTRPILQDAVSFNLAKKITEMKKTLSELIHGIERKQRSAASHVLFFLISDERRARKPYAVPIQYLAYSAITDSEVRQLTNTIKKEMTKIGMHVTGRTNSQATTEL